MVECDLDIESKSFQTPQQRLASFTVEGTRLISIVWLACDGTNRSPFLLLFSWVVVDKR